MAHHKSALKRIRQSLVRRERNRNTKAALRTVIKKFRATVDKDPEEAKQILDKAIPLISKAASKGIIHKKTASRNISRLRKKLNSVTAG